MGIEIERKFLIDRDKIGTLKNGYQIKQGYIKTVNYNTVRVRIRDKEAFLTLKSSSKGAKRLEFEYPIPLSDAQEMLINLCQKPLISKVRYLLNYEGHIWEIDVFEEDNQGLIVAEIELESEDEAFIMPSWVTKEVTEDKRYANSNLIENPYLNW